MFQVAMVACEATSSPETYWKVMLPNTPMPKILKDIIPPELPEGKSTPTSSGNRTNLHLPIGRFGFGYWIVYDPKENQVHADPNEMLYLLRKDMKSSNKLNLHLTKTTNHAIFLPRQVAESIPFSSNKFKDILNYFGLKPQSLNARILKTTINICEHPGIKGEKKYCATSLESMVEFITSELGNNPYAIFTELQKTPTQYYTITQVRKVGKGDIVVCHKQNYFYAVFYCHKTSTAEAYKILMVGDDGTKVKAVAVCHMDTSAWNPRHLVFQILNIEPGFTPVCHFLPGDHIVWISK